MKYLGYVELGDGATATSVVLPDFSGCFTAVDNEKDLNSAVQEAVELHFEGEDFVLPKPMSLAQAQQLSGFDYTGAWMFFDIDTSRISTKTKRINITMPENLLAKLDDLVAKEHISRSAKISSLVQEVI